jgi:hypothetical protein
MSKYISRVWEPVLRKGSDRYLQLMILSFAASVSLTRLILEVTGYPQLGNETLHIAHVLYGGVLLFAASLLPLIYANRWVYTWGGILSGVGIGLFIDEVGKFITQNNDYFFPAAAPIIYTFFLTTVLIYSRVRKESKLDARGELYAVLESLEDVIDHDLDEEEYNELRRRLNKIASTTSQPELESLANELMDFVDSEALTTIPEKPNVFDNLLSIIQEIESKWIKPSMVRVVIIIMLFGLGLPSFSRMLDFYMIYSDTEKIELMLSNIVDELPVHSSFNMMWAKVHILLDGLVGGVLTISGSLLILKKRRLGLYLGSIALMIALVGVNVVLFYLDQFSTIFIAVLEFFALQTLYYYQRRTTTSRKKPVKL